jgi:hypothetical protein
MSSTLTLQLFAAQRLFSLWYIIKVEELSRDDFGARFVRLVMVRREVLFCFQASGNPRQFLNHFLFFTCGRRFHSRDERGPLRRLFSSWD